VAQLDLYRAWSTRGWFTVDVRLGSMDPSRGPRWTGFTLPLLLSAHGGLVAPTAPSSPTLPFHLYFLMVVTHADGELGQGSAQ
jgi:hypothetical protein